MSTVSFEAKLSKIGSRTILKLPQSVSIKLPSREMVMVKGTINGFHFQTPLEPDGKGSHWFKIDKNMLEGAKVDAGNTLIVSIEPVKEWPESKVPSDLKNALTANPQAHALWMDITPMARWDWVRWIGSTKNPDTRKRRIEVTFSKFKAGKRRPCCFNRTMCTEPDVANNGVLLEPTQTKEKES